nr:glycoside hydrolase family 9 protein [Massilia sp. TS11]
MLLACVALAPLAGAQSIKLNTVGYAPDAAKLAVVPRTAAASFSVVDAASGQTVWRGPLQAAGVWDASGEDLQLADFSAWRQPGRYRLQVAGLPASAPFVLQPRPYDALYTAALKAFYYNRAGMAIAGPYARPAGHPDTEVRVHASAASPGRPAGTLISSPKGWYDAGDYNKYIVNSGIATYTLLAAHEHLRAPGVLEEARWNLDWMLSMQDPADGGVYHKLTNLEFDGMVMPHQATTPRYVVQKSTAATLDFAAVMAVASRVYPQPASARMLQAARAAWAWAQAHPHQIYVQPADVKTGEYGDDQLRDEFAWAAAELFITTGEPAFYRAIGLETLPARVADWQDVSGLVYLSLSHHRRALAPPADVARIEAGLEALAQSLLAQWRASPYRISMRAGEFVWGSNAVLLNQAMTLLVANAQRPHPDYVRAAQSALDYVLGRNALGRSLVTGQGWNPPRHPHHRPSQADGIADPVPGFVVGGPQPGQQDAAHCRQAYPSALPALSYLDDVCSYASNEVAINWNAPLVYVAAALNR